MTLISRFPDGGYDANGHWQRTKFCFFDCGDRCTCMPPMGVFQLPILDERPKGQGHPCLRNRAALARMQADMDALVRGHPRPD